MKKLKIEIQIIFLTVCIAVAVIVSGYLVYQSLSRIVDTIHKQARPDLRLLLIKDIASDLNEVENQIRLYSLTEDASFLKPYRQLNAAIQEKLSYLKEYAIADSSETQQIDSISLLVKRKLLIWDQIRALHRSKADAHNSFSSLSSKIDTVIVQSDTIKLNPEVRKSFFKRLFSKKDTTTKPPIIIDYSKEKEIIKQEIAGTEKKITEQAKGLQAKEKVLIERNIRATEILNQQIARIEDAEQKRLEEKTQEADSMADQTYHRLAIFTIGAVILLIVVLILFFINLHQNKTYQLILKKAKAEAESLAKAKEIFVATVSHEMRTPVNVIFGLTEQMMQKTDSVEMNADLDVVHKSAGHLISLVNDTLDFSKIESRTLKIEKIDFLPEEIFQDVYTLHKHSAQAKGIELILNYKADKNLALKGDSVRMKQILINLITNAIKFTNKGQITLLCTGKETMANEYLLEIEVADTGIGISREDQQKIFDEFVQLDSDLTQKQRGTGLGLAIVKKLVDLQNGKIDIDSIPGMGTRFCLQIPYQKGNIDENKTKSDQHPEIPSSFGKLHFLIVDDEEFNLYLIKNILKKWNVSYTEAHNGKEATVLSREKSFDLILLDIRMPLMDGYEAASKIFHDRSDSKIIALTATNKPEELQKSNQSGIQLFLQKPFTEFELFNAVIELLPVEFKQKEQIEYGIIPPVDLDELKKMTDGDPDFFKEMLSIFIRSSENGLATILDHFHKSEWDAISDAAHKLAAPAKHIHALKLYDNLKNLENETERKKDVLEIKRLIDAIQREVRQINAYLNQKLDEG